jgi:hypothetical protein
MPKLVVEFAGNGISRQAALFHLQTAGKERPKRLTSFLKMLPTPLAGTCVWSSTYWKKEVKNDMMTKMMIRLMARSRCWFLFMGIRIAVWYLNLGSILHF